jgi:hypothetical protein
MGEFITPVVKDRDDATIYEAARAACFLTLAASSRR